MRFRKLIYEVYATLYCHVRHFQNKILTINLNLELNIDKLAIIKQFTQQYIDD